MVEKLLNLKKNQCKFNKIKDKNFEKNWGVFFGIVGSSSTNKIL
jgi:hypothetical protein